MRLKTIKVSLENWKKLMKWKTELEYKNLDDVIDKILSMVSFGKLKEEENKK